MTQPARRPRQMATNVPTELLRSFVAIVDAGSMARATETILLSQSALSLQMKRLEDLLEQRLFHRGGRALLLTGAGEELAMLARQMLGLNDRMVAALGRGAGAQPLRLGLVQDVADTLLAEVLRAFVARFPDLRLQLRIGGSAELLEQFERSRLDLALCFGREDAPKRAASQLVAEEAMRWIGDPSLAGAEELKLALLDQPCAFRTALLDRLETQKRRYRIVLETPTLPGLKAAIRAGIGLTVRTARYAASENLATLDDPGLPALPSIATVLHRRSPSSEAVEALAVLLAEHARQRPPC